MIARDGLRTNLGDKGGRMKGEGREEEEEAARCCNNRSLIPDAVRGH